MCLPNFLCDCAVLNQFLYLNLFFNRGFWVAELWTTDNATSSGHLKILQKEANYLQKLLHGQEFITASWGYKHLYLYKLDVYVSYSTWDEILLLRFLIGLEFL